MEFLVTPPEGVPRGWMLSVNRIRTFVAGSTSRWPWAGVVSTDPSGAGIKHTSGSMSSSPTVLQATALWSSGSPFVLKTAVSMIIRI